MFDFEFQIQLTMELESVTNQRPRGRRSIPQFRGILCFACPLPDLFKSSETLNTSLATLP